MPEKRKPLIDDSEPAKEHSLEDDFNELIRRELGSPEPKPEIKVEPAPVVSPEIKIEPVKPKVEPKPVKAEKPIVKDVPKPIVKEAPKPVKEVPKPIPAPKPVVKPAPVKKVEVMVPPKKMEKVAPKPEPKVVAKVEPKKFEPKPVPKSVVKAQPAVVAKPAAKAPKKVEQKRAKVEKPVQITPADYSDDVKLGRWVALAVILLIAAIAVFAVGAYRGTKDSSALNCATNYAEERGVSLSWADASAVEQYWLKKAFESHTNAEAVEIFHMLGCDSAFVSSVTDPASYVDCKTPVIYIVVDERALGDNPMARLDKDSVLAKLNTETAMKEFSLAYKLAEPNVRAWKVVE